LPTLLELAGLPALPHTDGMSTLPAIMAAARGEPAPAALRDRTIFAQIDRRWGKVNTPADPSISIVRGPNRMYRRFRLPARDQLFDHTDDPDEVDNVLRHEPELAEELSGRIDEFRDGNEPVWETEEIELDEMRLNQLRALGYKIE
jgi:arylsulfatase A-like enzyme